MIDRGMLWKLSSLVAVALLGCGHGERVRTNREPTSWYEVRFTSAALPARRSSGAPWHTSAVDRSPSLIGGLIGLAVGYPIEGFAVGSALVDEPEAEAPAPFIVVKIAGDLYRISPVGQTLAPRWQQPLAVPARYPPETPALIQVLDAVDEGVLGQRVLSVGELLAPGHHTLIDVGELASLEYEVRSMPRRSPFDVGLHVDATLSLDELIAGGDASWAAIPVWNGDRITITAEGEVCPSAPTPCFGPEGADEGRWRSYNYDGFEGARHAALVAILPDQQVEIGPAASIVATESGFLLLFTNDTDEGNNAGGFDVNVRVTPAH